jgi:hypothetical protein
VRSAALKAFKGALKRSLSPTANSVVLLTLRRTGGSEYLSGTTTYRVPASVLDDKSAGFGMTSSWFYSRSWI